MENNPFYMRLPRNGKEFVLFMVVISVISVNIIAPVITFYEAGVSWEVYTGVLQKLVLIWPCVVATVLVTYRPAGFLTSRITQQGDGFRSCITINIRPISGKSLTLNSDISSYCLYIRNG